jgi:hypothetical protein
MPKIAEYLERFGALEGWFNAYVGTAYSSSNRGEVLKVRCTSSVSFEVNQQHCVCLHARTQEHVVLVDPYRPDEVMTTYAGRDVVGLFWSPEEILI